MAYRGHGRNGESPARQYVSPAEARAIAERQADEILGVSLKEAFEMLDRGELEGTAAEAEFSMLRFLIEQDEHRDVAPAE